MPRPVIVLGRRMLLAGVLVLAACGGGDGRTPEEVARHYVASTDPAKCDDAALGLLERSTNRHGNAARAACRASVKRFRPPAGVKVTGKDVEGTRAQVDLKAGGQNLRVQLTRRDGRWLVSGFGG